MHARNSEKLMGDWFPKKLNIKQVAAENTDKNKEMFDIVVKEPKGGGGVVHSQDRKNHGWLDSAPEAHKEAVKACIAEAIKGKGFKTPAALEGDASEITAEKAKKEEAAKAKEAEEAAAKEAEKAAEDEKKKAAEEAKKKKAADEAAKKKKAADAAGQKKKAADEAAKKKKEEEDKLAAEAEEARLAAEAEEAAKAAEEQKKKEAAEFQAALALKVQQAETARLQAEKEFREQQVQAAAEAQAKIAAKRAEIAEKRRLAEEEMAKNPFRCCVQPVPIEDDVGDIAVLLAQN